MKFFDFTQPVPHLPVHTWKSLGTRQLAWWKAAQKGQRTLGELQRADVCRMRPEAKILEDPVRATRRMSVASAHRTTRLVHVDGVRRSERTGCVVRRGPQHSSPSSSSAMLRDEHGRPLKLDATRIKAAEWSKTEKATISKCNEKTSAPKRQR